MTLKVIGCICIVFGCLCFGTDQIHSFKRRIFILREMERCLHMFQDLTQTYRLPLEIICHKISEQAEMPVSKFFASMEMSLQNQEVFRPEEIWRKTMESMGKAFDKEDQVLFLQMESFLGIQNLDTQNHAITNCREQIRERVQELETKRPEQEKINRVLAITVSGFLILLFI